MSKRNNLKILIIYIIILRIYSSIIHYSPSLENGFMKNPFVRKLNSDDNKKNLVIGAIVDLDWDDMRNFFISYAKLEIPNCDIIMFVGRIPKDAVEKMNYCGVITYDIPKEYLEKDILINNLRFKIYMDFLSKNKDKYNMVFTADVKDVVFQKDIFELYKDNPNPFMGFFFEDNIIRNEGCNYGWARAYCPEDNIYDKPIICSGTIIGSSDKFLEFCEALWKRILEVNKLTHIIDQGTTNCLIHGKKMFNDCIITKDNHGPIVAFAIVSRDKISLDNDNVLNYDGQVAYVVHQYNRHPDIVEKMNKKYNDTNIKVIKIKNSIKNNKNYKKIIFIFCIAIILLSIIKIYYFILSRTKKMQKNRRKKFRVVKISRI